MILPNNDNDQYFGAACRCVKIKYDGNGKEKGFYPDAISVPPDAQQKASNTFNKSEIRVMVQKESFILFPNPVNDVLNIDGDDNKDYYYQIYNMAGQMVKKGKFNDKKADLSTLTTGTYLVRINNSETVVKIIKK
jgi:hypothetical protein